MTKQAVIAIVVGVLILVGAAGAYLYSKNQSAKKAAVVAMHATPTPESSMQQSITDIFSSGKNSKCTFNTTGTSGDVSGIVYVSGDNARADFDMTTNGKSTATHMIRVGNTYYMWGDSLPTGMKMEMNVAEMAEKMKGAQPTGGAASFDPSKKVDIKCVSWTEDKTQFTPPSNVKFLSLPGTVPSGAKTTGTPTQGSATDTTNQCNICTALTGQAKSACLAQFHCQ